MVGFIVGAGVPEPLVTVLSVSLVDSVPSLKFMYVNPVLVSVVFGGPVPPSFIASAAAFSADMCMEVCLVAVTVLVVVSRVAAVAP